jgi:superfamily II DNA or RNA helicase
VQARPQFLSRSSTAFSQLRHVLKATKSLIIVNTIELAKQAAERVHQILGSKGVTVEIEQGQKYKATGMADVWVFIFA